MSESLRESVSALMDGEAEELELRRLLAESGSDEAVISETWTRYHLVQDVMHNEEVHDTFRHLDISAQVSMAISQENPAVTAKQASQQWWRPVAGFAVAASVAAAMVVGVQGTGPLKAGFDQSVLAAGSSVELPSVAGRVYPVQGTSLQASSSGSVVGYSATQLPGDIASSRAMADLEAEKRLQKYLLRHTEQAALNNGQGMISFARVVSFEQEQ